VVVLVEGSLEGKLPTIWTDEEQRSEKRRKEKKKEKESEEEDPGARKGTKVAKHCVFQ